MDMLGNKVCSHALGTGLGDETMDVSALRDGIYFWQALTDKGIADTGKLAIIR